MIGPGFILKELEMERPRRISDGALHAAVQISATVLSNYKFD